MTTTTVPARDWVDARLATDGFPQSEANRITLAVWRLAIADAEQPATMSDRAWEALRDVRLSDGTDDDPGTRRYLPELDSLRRTLVTGANPFDAIRVLHNLGVPTPFARVDGDYPRTFGEDDDAPGLFDFDVELSDVDAAALGLAEPAEPVDRDELWVTDEHGARVSGPFTTADWQRITQNRPRRPGDTADGMTDTTDDVAAPAPDGAGWWIVSAGERIAGPYPTREEADAGALTLGDDGLTVEQLGAPEPPPEPEPGPELDPSA